MTVFSDIYRWNGWMGEESRSGPGSGIVPTGPVAVALLELVAELRIRSVLDAACGDGLWMPDLPGYVGMDVAPEAVELARENHPRRYYLVRDAATLTTWPFDLVILRDALQHLSFEDGLAAIAGIRRTRSGWLLASTFVGGENVDIATGEAYSPDLTAAPFDLPAPDRLIPDGWAYAEPGVVRDERKHLGLWRLR